MRPLDSSQLGAFLGYKFKGMRYTLFRGERRLASICVEAVESRNQILHLNFDIRIQKLHSKARDVAVTE